MASLNLVLVEPQIPQNTGNIARTCAATGARLHLIEPLGFSVEDSRLKRAGLDYWHYLDISYYRSLEEFFTATNGPWYYFSTKGRNTHSSVSYEDGAYLLFGREDRGLPEELLHENPERCLRIPMQSGLRSLNLSNSVAIAAYEALRQWDYPELQNEGQLTKFNWEELNL